MEASFDKNQKQTTKVEEVASGVVAGTTQSVIFSMAILKRLAIGMWGNPVRMFKPVHMEVRLVSYVLIASR